MLCGENVYQGSNGKNNEGWGEFGQPSEMSLISEGPSFHLTGWKYLEN